MTMNNLTKQQVSDKLAADTAKFLADGGMITKLPYDDRAEKAARIGRWQMMGDPIHDDLEPRKYGEQFEDSIEPVYVEDPEQFASKAYEDAVRDFDDFVPLDYLDDDV